MSRKSEIAMTSAGSKLILRAIVEGKALEFTSAEAGTGVVADTVDLNTMTALISPIARGVKIYSKRIDSEDNIVIQVEVDNASFTQKVAIDEVGLYARIAGDSNPVLFSYMTFGDNPDIVPPASASTVIRMYHQVFALGTGTEVKLDYYHEVLPESLYFMDKPDDGVIEV